MDHRLIGVLGGMGPGATVDFLGKLVSLTPATCDQEHLPLLVHQVPQIPDRSAAILQGNDLPFEPMLMGLKRLASAGAGFAVIPCNSAHYWYERLAVSQPMSLLHIVDGVSRELQRRSMTSCRLGIMSTRGTVRSGIYAARLGERTNAPLVLEEQTQVLIDRSIAAVKSGQLSLGGSMAREAALRVRAQGADVLVLACTELPLALAGDPILEGCIDSSLALARYCVDQWFSDLQRVAQ